MSFAKPIDILVNGQRMQAEAGSGLLDFLRREGFAVPSLCHHPALSAYGACRLCLVEVQHGRKRFLATSCNFPVQAGLEVFLDTPGVLARRKVVLELLLAMAPDSERLRDFAAGLGVGDTPHRKKSISDKCILCGLCNRVCREGARAEALVFGGRGEKRYLARRPFGEFPEGCIGCGACAWICPTGAVSMEETWRQRVRSRWGEERPCRYGLLGILPGTLCENDYDCARCEIDQGMWDRAGGEHPVLWILRSRNPGGRP